MSSMFSLVNEENWLFSRVVVSVASVAIMQFAFSVGVLSFAYNVGPNTFVVVM